MAPAQRLQGLSFNKIQLVSPAAASASVGKCDEHEQSMSARASTQAGEQAFVRGRPNTCAHAFFFFCVLWV